MYILAFETTGPIGSVAIIDLEKVTPDGVLMGEDAICMKATDEPMSHLKNVMSLAKELLKEKGLSADKNQIAAVAASIGPGSFTGIRIGVSEARAIAHALGIPAIAVPTLEVFREYTFEKNQGRENQLSTVDGGFEVDVENEKPIVAAILNARRGQVYGAIYGPDGETIMEPGPYMLTDILEVTDKYPKTIFYGDGVDAYGTELTEGGRCLASAYGRYQTADLVAIIAAKKYMAGETVRAEELLPDYMRLAEAEQKLKDGTLQKLREAKMARMRHK